MAWGHARWEGAQRLQLAISWWAKGSRWWLQLHKRWQINSRLSWSCASKALHCLPFFSRSAVLFIRPTFISSYLASTYISQETNNNYIIFNPSSFLRRSHWGWSPWRRVAGMGFGDCLEVVHVGIGYLVRGLGNMPNSHVIKWRETYKLSWSSNYLS